MHFSIENGKILISIGEKSLQTRNMKEDIDKHDENMILIDIDNENCDNRVTT